MEEGEEGLDCQAIERKREFHLDSFSPPPPLSPVYTVWCCSFPLHTSTSNNTYTYTIHVYTHKKRSNSTFSLTGTLQKLPGPLHDNKKKKAAAFCKKKNVHHC